MNLSSLFSKKQREERRKRRENIVAMEGITSLLADDFNRKKLLEMLTPQQLKLLDKVTQVALEHNPAKMAKVFEAVFTEKMPDDPVELLKQANEALSSDIERKAKERVLQTNKKALLNRQARVKTPAEKARLTQDMALWKVEDTALQARNKLASFHAFRLLVYGTLYGDGGVYSQEEMKNFETARHFNPNLFRKKQSTK